jgi:hypothetical protein
MDRDSNTGLWWNKERTENYNGSEWLPCAGSTASTTMQQIPANVSSSQQLQQPQQAPNQPSQAHMVGSDQQSIGATIASIFGQSSSTPYQQPAATECLAVHGQ